jgi:hypothetical protein
MNIRSGIINYEPLGKTGSKPRIVHIKGEGILIIIEFVWRFIAVRIGFRGMP